MQNEDFEVSAFNKWNILFTHAVQKLSTISTSYFNNSVSIEVYPLNK